MVRIFLFRNNVIEVLTVINANVFKPMNNFITLAFDDDTIKYILDYFMGKIIRIS